MTEINLCFRLCCGVWQSQVDEMDYAGYQGWVDYGYSSRSLLWKGGQLSVFG